jgi:teichuronic acid exporter
MLMSGNGLAQIIQLGGLVLLARLFTPSDFGYLGLIQSISTIVAVFITMQLHLTIPLSANEEEAEKRLFITNIVSFSLFLLLLIPFVVSEYLQFFALFLALILGLANSFTSFLVFRGKFGKLSKYYIIRSLIIVVFQIVFGLLTIKYGLVYGAIFGEVFGSLYLGLYIFNRKLNLRILYAELIKINIFKYILEKKQFSMYGTLQEFVSVAGFYLPLLLFIHFFGEYIGGQYAMANRLVWAPVVLLSSSLAQVYYHEFAQKNNWAAISKWFWFQPMYLLALLIILVLFYFIKDVVTVVLGQQWNEAKEMMLYMILSGIFFIYSIPFRVAYRALEKLSYLFTLEAFFLLILMVLFYIFQLEYMHMMLCLTAVSFFQAITIVYIIKNYSHKSGIHAIG